MDRFVPFSAAGPTMPSTLRMLDIVTVLSTGITGGCIEADCVAAGDALSTVSDVQESA
jgi:hypothetical protein